MSDFDGGWKDVLDFFLREFLRFFAPEIDAEVDWVVDSISLEQEFRALAPQAESGDVRCDKLVRLALRADAEPAYLHVEAQCQVDGEFPRRMCDYNHRATQHYHGTVASLAVLGDDNPSWRPSGFHRERWSSRGGLDFRAFKLLDYRGRDEELERHENPVGVVVLAHLKALETRRDPAERRAWRLRLWRAIRQRKMDGEDLQHLQAVVERFLALPREIEAELWREIRQEEREGSMPYVTSFERFAKEEALRKGIMTAVRIRFGGPDPAFVALLEQADLDKLDAVLTAAETVPSLDDLRALLTPSNGHAP